MNFDPKLLPDHHQPQLGRIFADELGNYPWSSALEPFYSRLRATDKAILEVPDEYQLFSSALWDLCFPRLATAELWHYTTLESFASILKTKEVWLHSLVKRIGEGELTEFGSQFDYRGLLDFDDKGNRNAEGLAKNLFYLSLTDQNEPGEMWGYGEVRLRLRITPLAAGAHLRKMGYSAGSEHPINVLKKFAQARFNRVFVPWQVSRQGSFFLDSYHSWESEVRLLVKRFDETTDLVVRNSNGGEAVAIPLSTANSRVLVDLVHVECETAVSLKRVRRLLQEAAKLEITSSLHVTESDKI